MQMLSYAIPILSFITYPLVCDPWSLPSYPSGPYRCRVQTRDLYVTVPDRNHIAPGMLFIQRPLVITPAMATFPGLPVFHRHSPFQRFIVR
jgi:hypothetical protein